MRTPSAVELLHVWEIGLAQHPIHFGLALLALAWPETPTPDFARVSIGQRDAALLTLREQLFGTRLNSIARCPQCGEQLELSFQVDQVRAPIPQQAAQPLQVQMDEYTVSFRSPNSGDLLAIAGVDEPAAARQQLLQRCLIAVEQAAQDITDQIRKTMPDLLVAQLLRQIAQADPQGDVQLALACPACQHEWLMTFDILAYLWSEINDWAQRTLREVHLLATAYGWREADILALSAQRRQFYLTMIGK